jgi:type IV secretion system protein VirB11
VGVLREAVLSRKNILVVGGTDSGKTTFVNALLRVVEETTDRIVILEDTQELQCRTKDVEYLHTKEGVASLRDLVRFTLRLSPDRVVIGEVRGAEALDLLKAWNTGHPGGVSTVHANSAEKGLLRLEQLVQEAGVVPSKIMIAEAVNVLVYMEKKGTKRVVKDIMQVRGTKREQYDLVSLIGD